jgi:hypothetical protein
MSSGSPLSDSDHSLTGSQPLPKADRTSQTATGRAECGRHAIRRPLKSGEITRLHGSVRVNRSAAAEAAAMLASYATGQHLQ